MKPTAQDELCEPFRYPDDEPQVQPIQAEAVRAVLEYVWRGAFTPNSATTRLAAITAQVCPEIFDGKSYRAIGHQLGCTGANISKHAVAISDDLGLKFRRQKSEQSRGAYSKAHGKAWRGKVGSP